MVISGEKIISLSDKISYKTHNSINTLDLEEREYLEGLLYEWMLLAKDEELMQLAMEKGIIL